MSKDRLTPKQYDQLCNRLQRLRIEGEGDGKLAKTSRATGKAPQGKAEQSACVPDTGPNEPTSAPEIIPHPSMSFVPCLTTPESKMNRHEIARLKFLKSLAFPLIRVHAFTLNLAFDCRYTPDFSYVDENGVLTFEEVKGFRRDDAMVKLRVAARMFREFRFRLVSLKKDCWQTQEVKP